MVRVYDDFVFRGASCQALEAHAFFGESSTLGATISRNLYELPGGDMVEIGEPSYKTTTRSVTIAPVDGVEADEAWCRRVLTQLCGGRGELVLERDPLHVYVASFDKAATLDNKAWPDGCLRLNMTVYGLLTDLRPTRITGKTAGGKCELRASFSSGESAPLTLELAVTSGTVTAAEIAVGGQKQLLYGLSAGAGTVIRYVSGGSGLRSELTVGGVVNFGVAKNWARLRVRSGDKIAVTLTGGEASVTAILTGRWVA